MPKKTIKKTVENIQIDSHLTL